MSDREGKQLTAEQLLRRLQSDPDWVEAREAEDRGRLVNADAYDHDAAPVKADLEQAGFAVESLDDLRHSGARYDLAIPILLRWLPKVDNPDVKESIVRNLAVGWAGSEAAHALVQEFRRADDPTGTALRWAIANALAEVADDSVLEDVSGLARDPRYGRAREMLALALGRIDDQRAVETLRELLGDDEVAGHAIVALGTLRSEDAKADIEPFLDHPKRWVREEAKRALNRIG